MSCSTPDALHLTLYTCLSTPDALHLVLQAEKVLSFSPETNLTALLLEARDLEARVIILSARWVFGYLLFA